MEKIRIEIDNENNIKVEVSGVKGKSCKDLTKYIEQLGVEKSTRTTREYFEKELEQEKNKEKGG
jgi:hypothetical protein